MQGDLHINAQLFNFEIFDEHLSPYTYNAKTDKTETTNPHVM